MRHRRDHHLRPRQHPLRDRAPEACRSTRRGPVAVTPSSRSRAQSCCSSTGAVRISPPGCRRSMTSSSSPADHAVALRTDATSRRARVLHRRHLRTAGAVSDRHRSGRHRGSHHGRGHRPRQRRVRRGRRRPRDRLREGPQGPGRDRPDPQLAALHRARGTRDGVQCRYRASSAENELWAVLHEAVITGGGDTSKPGC